VVAGVASAISSGCTVAGAQFFANVRNPGIASFIGGLVSDVARR
jgi:hypothetical protein